MTTTQVPPGIYHIVVAGGVQSDRLTRNGENGVTILLAGGAPEHEQEVLHHFLAGLTVRFSPALVVANRCW